MICTLKLRLWEGKGLMELFKRDESMNKTALTVKTISGVRHHMLQVLQVNEEWGKAGKKMTSWSV